MWFILITVCALGVPFYLRFLAALRLECRHGRICNVVRVESANRSGSAPHLKQSEKVFERVA
jgi:hypothetical protein